MNKLGQSLRVIFIGFLFAVFVSTLPVFAKDHDKDGMNHNPPTTPGKQPDGPQTEPEATTWKTFVLSSANQLRLPPQPDKDETKAELKSLRDLLATTNAASDAQVAFWNAGSPGYRWMQTAVNELTTRNISGPLGTRALALLGVAIYDSTVAAWDSKYFYQRERPSEVDHQIQPILPDPQSPSYPSEHAVVAGAAAAVLSYLFSSDAANFHTMAEQAAQSRLFTGLQYPSDTAAGLQLGRAVGDMGALGVQVLGCHREDIAILLALEAHRVIPTLGSLGHAASEGAVIHQIRKRGGVLIVLLVVFLLRTYYDAHVAERSGFSFATVLVTGIGKDREPMPGS
jgi:hypothetical protein